jgi:hypothetical protein
MAKFATSLGMLSTPQTNFVLCDTRTDNIRPLSSFPPPSTPQASSVSRISSCRRESVNPPFIPPSAIRPEHPPSRLPHPTATHLPQDRRQSSRCRHHRALASITMTALTTPAASATLGFGDPLRTARRRVVRRALKVAQPTSKFQELIYFFFLPRW